MTPSPSNTPIYTELKETFTPNSTIRKRMDKLAIEQRKSSGSDPVQLRVFTDDEGEAIHMGVVAGELRRTPNVLIGMSREEVVVNNYHPLYLKATNFLQELSEKFSAWVAAHTPKKPETVYRSSYQLV